MRGPHGGPEEIRHLPGRGLVHASGLDDLEDPTAAPGLGDKVNRPCLRQAGHDPLACILLDLTGRTNADTDVVLHLLQSCLPVGVDAGLSHQASGFIVPVGILGEDAHEVTEGPLGTLEVLSLSGMVKVHVRSSGEHLVAASGLDGLAWIRAG